MRETVKREAMKQRGRLALDFRSIAQVLSVSCHAAGG